MDADRGARERGKADEKLKNALAILRPVLLQDYFILVAAKPECSIAELREVKRKADKEKIFGGIQPRSSDFRSQLNCNLVPSIDFPVPGETCPINPTFPVEVHECCVG